MVSVSVDAKLTLMFGVLFLFRGEHSPSVALRCDVCAIDQRFGAGSFTRLPASFASEAQQRPDPLGLHV